MSESHSPGQSAPAQSAIGLTASPSLRLVTSDHLNSGLFVNARREAASLATPALVLKVAPLILKQARDRARLHDLIMSAIKLALEDGADVDHPALLENIRTLQEAVAEDGTDLHGAVEVLMERALASANSEQSDPPLGELPKPVISLMAEASAEIGEIATMLAERADEAQEWLSRGMAQRIDTLNNLVYALADGQMEEAKAHSQAAYGRTRHLCHGVPA
jgi:hypothetical protein